MRIDRVVVRNYKNFFEPTPVHFSAGLNIIVGQNGAGKTTLLEALSLSFQPKPNRSLTTVPDKMLRPDPTSSVDFVFDLSREELWDLMRIAGGEFYLGLPDGAQGRSLVPDMGTNVWDHNNIEIFLRWFLDQPHFHFQITRSVRGNDEEWHSGTPSSHGMFAPRIDLGGGTVCASVKVLRDNALEIGARQLHGGTDIGVQIAQHARARIYRFSSERFIPATCSHGDSRTLSPNGNNLAEVLNHLQHNRAQFDEFNRLVSEVIPQVRYVSVRPFGQHQNEVVVWHFDPTTARDDLAVSLSETGSGIGQVLALLYVVFSSEFPRVILIDEPQSFLHPSAVRKLLEVLARYSQHQFIISTHAPAVVSAVHPKTILMLTGTQEVKCEQLDMEAADSLRLSLNELGARLSDVFGADNILWVEGLTEEICFPLILREIGNVSLMGTAILGVRRTGDLQGKDAERVFEIYESISASNILLPPAIGFIFDRENRNDQQQRELIRRSKNRLSFLPRRMYENYLLNVDAITQVINSYDRDRAFPLANAEVQEFFEDHHLSPNYFDAAPEEETWRENIDGARFLAECFKHFTDTRIHYDKVTHGHELTKWICANSRQEFRQLNGVIETRLH